MGNPTELRFNWWDINVNWNWNRPVWEPIQSIDNPLPETLSSYTVSKAALRSYKTRTLKMKVTLLHKGSTSLIAQPKQKEQDVFLSCYLQVKVQQLRQPLDTAEKHNHLSGGNNCTNITLCTTFYFTSQSRANVDECFSQTISNLPILQK